ncbi:hypothetical protein BDCR2A_01754 [Borrelia duttonii CR2A]|uniref:Uncharacterized protein n=1 Tax=Borrelia duttonii CR2A TaxID=1432657 RepID=W6TF66_9SPIR|nr:hypothetical protein [Borrelia duttonii]ETZ17322.1 hypothetical protein BDCR2A_01754 [Borrelia duttonii CR2A]
MSLIRKKEVRKKLEKEKIAIDELLRVSNKMVSDVMAELVIKSTTLKKLNYINTKIFN